jgi:hypothetical protein
MNIGNKKKSSRRDAEAQRTAMEQKQLQAH